MDGLLFEEGERWETKVFFDVREIENHLELG
jgi:hypothetical protein